MGTASGNSPNLIIIQLIVGVALFLSRMEGVMGVMMVAEETILSQILIMTLIKMETLQ